jgi:hypothetical protein
MYRCRYRKNWQFSQMARSFYDSKKDFQIVEVHGSPLGGASHLQKDSDSSGLGPPTHKTELFQRAGSLTSQCVNRKAVLSDSEAMHKVRMAQEEVLTMTLKHVFEQYNRWGGGVNRSRMDKMRFHKVLRHVSRLSLCKHFSCTCGSMCA